MTARSLNPCPLPYHEFQLVQTRDGEEGRCSACGSVVPAMAGRWYVMGVRDAVRSMAIEAAEIRSAAAVAAGNGRWIRADVDGEAPQTTSHEIATKVCLTRPCRPQTRISGQKYRTKRAIIRNVMNRLMEAV
jgi:hypothetical protein